MNAYDFALNESNDEDDIHLIRLRKGYYLLEDQAFHESKFSFLKALEKHQTPQAWLGLGIACYNLDEIEDAELALIESNMLDNTIPTAWAYLAMVNLRKANMDMFDQCISEAKKFGLDDEELIAEIEALREEIACEPPRMFPRWKISQVDGNFRPSIAEKFSPVRQSTTGSKLEGFVSSKRTTINNIKEFEPKKLPAPTRDVEVDIVPTRDVISIGRASLATARQSTSRTTIHKACGSYGTN
ncbi:Hypothetical protein NTJ_00209 [Nesidiocoris tenuis]|uniref:Uncharacterized protein n=1 Tax=Nesidiocoris tenuis TaxID=355587 RepID=A0ABN7A5D2_9HEMI|nr:Hypothetical protein NTJ_00209 [Nesidiocoris tenuis]